MRTLLITAALAGLGLGLAATFLPVTSASAYCDMAYYERTGDCTPCHTLQRVYPRLMCLQ